MFMSAGGKGKIDAMRGSAGHTDAVIKWHSPLISRSEARLRSHTITSVGLAIKNRRRDSPKARGKGKGPAEAGPMREVGCELLLLKH